MIPRSARAAVVTVAVLAAAVAVLVAVLVVVLSGALQTPGEEPVAAVSVSPGSLVADEATGVSGGTDPTLAAPTDVASGTPAPATASAEAVPEGVTRDEAVALALQRHPGRLLEAELDTDDGRTVWEVDVLGDDGIEYSIEVDPVTGSVTEDD